MHVCWEGGRCAALIQLPRVRVMQNRGHVQVSAAAAVRRGYHCVGGRQARMCNLSMPSAY
jgi:hypothetical protein